MDKEELLARLEAAKRDGKPVVRPGISNKPMACFDDLVVVPSKPMAQGSKDIGTDVSIGLDRYSEHPIHLEVPIYIADMSYGEIGRTSKAALALGAALAGSMVLCGHGAILSEEKEVTDENDGRLVAKWSKGRFGNDIGNISFCHGVCIDLSMDPGILVPADICTKEVAEAYGVPRGTTAQVPISL